MALTVLFIVMIILSAVLLFTSSLTSVFGAIDSFNSNLYNTNINLRNAHNYLTIGASLGFSALFVLIITLIIGYIAGGFTYEEISNAILERSKTGTLTQADVQVVQKEEREIASGRTTQIIVLIILILISIVTLAVGVLATMAAMSLSNMTVRDNTSQAAYIQSIIASVSAIGGVGLIIVAIVTYVSIRSARAEELAKADKIITGK